MSNDASRINKISNKWIPIMFESFENIYLEIKDADVISTNERFNEFLLNRIFRGIIIHSYRRQYGNDINSLTKVSCASVALEAKMSENRIDNRKILDSVLTNGLWNRIDLKMMQHMCGSDLNNISLMKLLILTFKFLVECETSLNDVIKCINCLEYSKNERNDRTFLLNSELNKCGSDFRDATNDILANNRRLSMDGTDDLIATEKISVLLHGNSNINARIKLAHKNGISCTHRHLCRELASGLAKLIHSASQMHIPSQQKNKNHQATNKQQN